MISERPRFPFVLSLVCAAAFAVLVGLGAWQLQRLHWKQAELARIARLNASWPQPIAAVLVLAARGQDVELSRVAATCAPAPRAPARLKMTTDNGQWIARALAPCRLAGAPYAGVIADLGFIEATRGQTEPGAPVIPAPVRLTGVLFKPAPPDGPTPPGFAPYLLSVETEAPPEAGVVPAPYAVSAADNLEYVGDYAPTWFGLAGVLAGVYAALLWRRLHPKS